MKPNDLKRLAREEHEGREDTRRKIKKLRGTKKSAPIPRTIREQRAAENGRRARGEK